MSNPILRPDDPRFRQPQMISADGKNRFADSAEPPVPATADEPFAATAETAERPYLPRYDEQQQPRTGLLLTLSSLGWLGAGLGLASLAGLYDSGWICPLLGIAPAAVGWLLAHQDLSAIETGAIRADAYRATWRAHWLGVTALVATLALTIGLIFLQKNFLPEGL